VIYTSSTNFINEDGSINIDAVSDYIIERYETDPSRQQIRLPIDSTSLAVLRKAIGVVNNVTPTGGVIVDTNALVNGIVSGYIKSANYVAGSTGWTINADGSVEFSNGTFRGYISASSGTIGGFTINATSLQDVAGMVGLSSAVTAGDDIRFWAGNATPASAPFYVTEAGILKATSGTIGPWTLSSTAISTGDYDTVSTLYFGTSGLSLSNTFKVSAAGALTATSGTIAGWIIGANTLSKSVIVLDAVNDKITVDTTKVILDSSGITATAGTIGGWTLGSSELYAGADQSKIGLDTSNGIYAGAETFVTSPFRVGLDGNLVASNANITGVIAATSITAQSGTIGGFIISPTQMYGGIIKTAANVSAGSTGVIMDTAGLRGYDSVLGEVFNLPTDGSPPSFSSGVIQNTTFEINTNAVLRTSSTVGDGSANSAGILINNTGLYGCEANQTLANANIKINTDGTAVFNASVRGGQTDYATGTGYFLGLSGGDYKFSIGSDSNYMRWNGEYLILKGSFDVGSNGIINNSVYTVANLPVSPTVVGFNNPSSYE
jgi:hypothetical protein